MTLAVGVAFGCSTSAPPAVQAPLPAQPPLEAPSAPLTTVQPTAEPLAAALPVVSPPPTEPPPPASPAIEPAPPAAVQTQPLADIGYKTGDHVPPFQITLVDGTEVSSEVLLSSGKPVFLFFTASW